MLLILSVGLVLLVLQITLKFLQRRIVMSPSAQSQEFFGKQIAKNYYEFSILDYHRMLIQKKPFLLSYYSPACSDCEKQDEILIHLKAQENLKETPIFRVNIGNKNRDEQIKIIASTYRYEETPTLIFVDRDSNPVEVLTGMPSEAKLENLLGKI